MNDYSMLNNNIILNKANQQEEATYHILKLSDIAGKFRNVNSMQEDSFRLLRIEAIEHLKKIEPHVTICSSKLRETMHTLRRENPIRNSLITYKKQCKTIALEIENILTLILSEYQQTN